jgi:DNA-binding transcriptional MocR family regulator
MPSCAAPEVGTQGGMLPGGRPEGLDSQALLEAALSRSISFAPGLVFSTEPRFGHCLRINCGQPWSTQLAEDIHLLGWLAAEQLAGG